MVLLCAKPAPADAVITSLTDAAVSTMEAAKQYRGEGPAVGVNAAFGVGTIVLCYETIGDAFRRSEGAFRSARHMRFSPHHASRSRAGRFNAAVSFSARPDRC